MSLNDTAIDGRFSINVSLLNCLRGHDGHGFDVNASVLVRHGTGGKGRLEIRYNSMDELDGILEHIK